MRKAAIRALFFGIIMILFLASAALAEEMPTLSYNSAGDAVLTLQQRLTELGYYTFRITGVYQENSQRAVQAFQADNGLPVTGVADAALQQMILSPYASPKATPVPAPTPTPLVLTASFSGKLEYGSVGDNVTRVQARLSAMGYYGDKISGQFLGNTRNAVKAFQKQNGLAVDGVVGETTWQALFLDNTAVDAFAPPKPTPVPTPVPYRIGVDVTNQVTTVYGLDEQGNYTQVVKDMICSTGTASDPTPLKTYVLNGAVSRWCYFPKWGSHAQYWTRMDGSNAFHSVIYTAADEMTLAVGSYTGLGKRASHGCIRLMVADAKWIYDNCGKGTEVVVYEGPPNEEMTKSLKIPPLDYSRMLPQPTPAPTQPPLYNAGGLPPMPFRTLSRGTESEAVYWLQCKLTDLGYYAGPATGGYYKGTIEAVKAFQRDHGLSVDGQAGKQTLSAIYEDVLATPSPSPVPTPHPTPRASATVPPRSRPTSEEGTASVKPTLSPSKAPNPSASAWVSPSVDSAVTPASWLNTMEQPTKKPE